MVLQRGDVVVHHSQGMKRLDEVVIVHPQVLKVVSERRKVGGAYLALTHDLGHACLLQQQVGHLHHRSHMRTADQGKGQSKSKPAP